MLTKEEQGVRLKAYEYYLANELISVRAAERYFNFSRGILDRFIKINNLSRKNSSELIGKLNSARLKCKKYTSLTDKQQSILEGYVLSDGGIFKSRETGTARLNIVNTNKAFCDYALANLPFEGKVVLQRKASDSTLVVKNYAKTKDLFAYYSKVDLCLNELHKKWYENKVKILPEDFKLDPLKVLIWFLGDGYSSFVRKQITVGLCVNNFNLQEIQRIIYLFKNLSIDFKTVSTNYGTSYGINIYNRSSILNFYDYIQQCPEELNCFNYKWKTYN